jgi:hypothetical protein
MKPAAYHCAGTDSLWRDFFVSMLLFLLASAGVASRRHIVARSPLSDHEDRPVPLESKADAIIPPSSHHPTADPSSGSECIYESKGLATFTSTFHLPAVPQYPAYPTSISGRIHFLPYPSPSGFTSARSDPNPSSGRDSVGHFPSYPALVQGVPAQFFECTKCEPQSAFQGELDGYHASRCCSRSTLRFCGVLSPAQMPS